MKKLMIVSLIALSVFVGSYKNVYADDVEDTKNKIENVQNSTKEAQTKLDETTKSKEDALKEIDSLDKELNELSKEISDMDSKIKSFESEIQNLEKSIAEKVEQIKKNQILLDERINTMYKSGNEGYLEILLKSKDLSEAFQNITAIKQVMEYDKNIINTMVEDKNQVEKQKIEMEAKKKALTETKASYDKKYSELQSKLDEKNKIVKDLQESEDGYKKLIDQQKQEEDELKRALEMMQNTSSRGGAISGSVYNGKYYSVTGGSYAVTSPYGPRISPVGNGSEFHTGIDIGVPYGTTIYSLADGTVTYAGWMNGYGNVVQVNHGSLATLYAHNASLLVSVGQTVKGGQAISISGSTGWSTGPHLHFEVSVNGERVNPAAYYVK